MAILEEDQRPPSVRKGGTVCISKSKEWNGLARSPKRATYPASLMRLKRGALPEPELLSCLRTAPLVFGDDLLIDDIVPPLPFSLFLRKLAAVENSGGALISSGQTERLIFDSAGRRSPPSGGGASGRYIGIVS